MERAPVKVEQLIPREGPLPFALSLVRTPGIQSPGPLDAEADAAPVSTADSWVSLLELSMPEEEGKL